MPRISTHIGIAFYAADGFPYQSAVVLSTHMRFDGTASCGTVIESVNGRVVAWKKCDKSPATYEPHLKLVGIITVGRVDHPMTQILESIESLEWKAQDSCASSDKSKELYSNDYVRRVLLYLCQEKTISLPTSVKGDLDDHMSEGLSELRRVHASKFNLYPVISLAEYDGAVFGRTRF